LTVTGGALLSLLALVVPVHHPCWNGPSGQLLLGLAARAALERAGTGLSPLLPSPALCRVASFRAAEVAQDPRTLSDPRAPITISRALVRAGYRAHRFQERIVVGATRPDQLIAQWLAPASAGADPLLLGGYEEVGTGTSGSGSEFVVVLLVALPELTFRLGEAAPLRDLEADRGAVLAAVNRLRAERRRPPLENSSQLDLAAQGYAERLLARGRLSHVSAEGSHPGDRARAAGYPYRLMAENLARGLFTPQEVVDRWMISRDHRRNLLHPAVRDMGLGVAVGLVEGEVEVVWVQMLGRR
jgi:uncharacterized protein YkwD